MIPQTPTAPTTALQRLQRENTELRRQNAGLHRRIQRTHAIMGNAHLSAGQRLTAVEIANRLDAHRDQADSSGAILVSVTGVAEATGQSKDSVSAHIKALEACGAWQRRRRTIPDPATGNPRTELRLVPSTTLQRPGELAPPAPRNHGGKRIACSNCGSLRLVARTQIVCCDCDSPVESYEHKVNRDAHKAHKRGLRGLEPHLAALDDAPDQAALEPHLAALDDAPDQAALGGAAPRRNLRPFIRAENNQRGGGNSPAAGDAAGWLVAWAGDGEEHLEMQARGDHKYLWRAGAITPELARRHLAGLQTIGATLNRADGRAWALCWDADDAGAWATLQRAAAQLTASGATALLEPSPARGGHLWIVFAEPVDAPAATATATAAAPELAIIRERWPHPTQGVRLPGGRYVARGMTIWPAIMAPGGASATGRDAIALMRQHATPAGWVQAAPPAVVSPPAAPSGPRPGVLMPPPSLVIGSPMTGERPLPAALTDARWLAQYGDQVHTLWFGVTEVQAVAWFNQATTCRELLPPQPSGYGLAVWRQERTASVSYTGTGWVDRGTGDAGDALELHCCLHGLTRAEALRAVVLDMIAAARAELEAAAWAGVSLPGWTAAITTPAGWRRYDALRRA